MKKRIGHICLVIFLMTTSNLSVKGYYLSIDKIIENNEMPESPTYSIYQDRNGFIWAGTQFGFYRYDGTNLKMYTPDYQKQKCCTSVFEFFEDKHGRLWFSGISKRLFYLENDTVVDYPYNDKWMELIEQEEKAYVKDLYVTDEGIYYNSRRQFYFASFEGEVKRIEYPNHQLYIDKRIDGHEFYVYNYIEHSDYRKTVFEQKSIKLSLIEKDGSILPLMDMKLDSNELVIASLFGFELEQNKYVLGFSKGLYLVNHDKETRMVQQYDHRILKVQKGINRLYVSVYKEGLYVYNLDDLAGNHTHFLLPGQHVSDVLESKDEYLWLSNSKGVTRLPNPDLDTTQITKFAPRDFKITGVFVNKKETTIERLADLGLKENNISFNFESPYFHPSEHTRLEYQLDDNDWVEIEFLRINFESLGPGSHSLKIRAINANNEAGEATIIPIYVEVPLFQKWWFLSLLLLIAIGIVIAIAFWRIKVIRRNERRETEILKQLSNMKDEALRAKLNPHFVFNSLNSIQRLFLEDEKEKASDYMADFALLFRKILNLSDQPKVTVETELEVLKWYLDIELLRFDNRLSYSFNYKKSDELLEFKIPSIILQPIVENSIWHGIMPRKAEKDFFGKIDIEISLIEDGLSILIKDNGIGYQKSMEAKAKMKNYRESKGLGITEMRLKDEGSLSILDNKPNGTTVQIIIKPNYED